LLKTERKEYYKNKYVPNKLPGQRTKATLVPRDKNYK
jgi:hypothetical protein